MPLSLITIATTNNPPPPPSLSLITTTPTLNPQSAKFTPLTLDPQRNFTPKLSGIASKLLGLWPKIRKYTLGGFFLASYDDSPVGIFDELVVIAGIVWNPPTSCAWAARVLVSSDEACVHGRKAVGLPSQAARFSKQRITAIPRQSESKANGFLGMIGVGTAFNKPMNCLDIQVTEVKGPVATDICTISVGTAALAKAVPEPNLNKLTGPVIKMSLPSFSGRTEYNPHLLKYSCQIECRIRAVHPAKVSALPVKPKNDTEQSPEQQSSNFVDSMTRELGENERNLSISVMLSKPILALEFNCLKMQVGAPIIVFPCSKNTSRSC